MLVFSAFFSSIASGAVTVSPEPTGAALVVENEYLHLIVDPSRGGAVVSFVHKPTGRDVVRRDTKHLGLFMDHLWGQTWPGELLEVPYESQVVKNGQDEAIVKVWRTVSGEWQGVQQKIIQGLVIEKTFTVPAGMDAVFCHVAVRNPQPAGRLPAYWMQHVFYAGGDYDATTDVFYRPSTRGVRASWQGSRQEDFLRDATAGWSAAVDKPKGQGLVFLMDYNDLDMLYNCGGNSTLEWMYDKIPVPAGRSWETDIVLIPTEGLREFAHASRAFIAGMEVQRSGNTLTLTHQLRAALHPVQNLTLSVKVVGAADRRETVVPPLAVGGLTTALKTVPQTVEAAAADPLAILVGATGKADGREFSESYFAFYAGGYGYGDNVQQDMSTPLLKIPRPEKKQVLMRPTKLERPRNDYPKLFVIKGLHAERYRLSRIIEGMWMNVTVGIGAYSVGQEGPRTTDFPFDYDALMAQDAIIVANANLQCLGKLGLMMLRDYLTHGGNLLLLGGKAAYGGGGLVGSGLEDLLPVEVEPTLFDLEHLRQSSLAIGAKHSITDWFLKYGSMADCAVCPYLHRVKVRPGSTVAMTAGGRPFLVVREAESGGRVACVLGAPYGAEEGKPPVFYRWHGWDRLLCCVLEWVAQQSASK